MNELQFFIKGNPLAKQSARFTKSGLLYQPKHITQYKNNLQFQIISQLPIGFIPIVTPISVEYHFIFPFLTTHSRKKRLYGKIYKSTKPDLDNLQKAVNDALNSIVFKDDSQICQTIVSKFFGSTPGINITIKEII